MANLFSDVYNPLQDAVKDPENLRHFFSQNKLVPYFGNSAASSHSTLRLLYELAKLSQSKESVVNFVLRHGFEGNIDLCYMDAPGLKLSSDEEVISDEVKREISNELFSLGIDLSLINLSYAKRHIADWKTCGNIYMLYEEVEVSGVKKVKVEYIHPKSFFYIMPDNGSKPTRGLIFKYGWNMNAEAKKQGEEVPVYPNFIKTPTGRKTLIHVANLKDGSDVYGRPDDFSTVAPQYVQYCNYDLASKISNKEIVTKYLIANQTPEDPGVDAAGENAENARQVRNVLQRTNMSTVGMDGRQMTINEDKSNTVAFLNYSGEKPPTVIKLDIARDTAWSKYQRVATSHDIFIANGLHPDLMGFSDQNGSANSKSGEFILQLLKSTDITVIRPLQETYSVMWSTIFRLCGEFVGNDSLRRASVKFPAKITSMIKESVDLHNSVRQDGKATNENGDTIEKSEDLEDGE